MDTPPESAPESAREPEVHDSSRDRIRLRFPGLKDQRPPIGFMHIDEALDRLGAHRFPAEWGQSPVWENHPFRYEEAAKRFCSYRAGRNNAGLWQFDRVPLTAVYDDVALRLADQRYKKAVAELSEALGRGLVKASLVGRSRDREPVSVTSLIWTRQNVGIFFTGYRYEVLGVHR